MNSDEAVAAVRAFFALHWGSTTRIAWPDMNFTPPQADTWVRFSMKNSIGYQASMGNPGNNIFRREGIITIQVFQKEGRASTDARKKAAKAETIFMKQKLAGFEFKNVNVLDIGAGRDEIGLHRTPWYQMNVTAEYRYDQTA